MGGHETDPVRHRAKRHVILAMVTLALLLGWLQGRGEPSWALPYQNSLRDTINTPVPSATPGPTATPSPTAAPGVRRLLLQEIADADVTQDTWIYAYIPNLPQYGNDAGGLRLKGGEVSSVLVRFDLGALPSDAHVVAAELAFYVEIPSGVPSALDVAAYRVLRPWDERQASWRYANALDGMAWSAPGCNGEGADRVATPDDTVTLLHRAVWRGWDVTESVRYWRAHPDENYGWLLKGVSPSTASFTFRSSRWQVPSERPLLRIDYTQGTPIPTATPTSTATPRPTPQGSGIHVTVYEDRNRDQWHNAGEPGIAEVRIDLLDNEGRKLQTRRTDADGMASWDALATGCYQVREIDPWGYRSSTANHIRLCVNHAPQQVLFGDYAVEAVALPLVIKQVHP